MCPCFAGQQVDIYRAQALVKSQSEAERNAAARVTFGELMVRVSGQRNALDNPVVRAAMPKAQNYLFGFSYKSSSEKLVEGSRSFTALALQLNYEPQAIGQLLRDAQLPLWPAQRPTLLVWLVFKDQRGLHLVPEVIDFQAINSFAAYRGLPLVFPKHDVRDSFSISAQDVWDLDQVKIKAASERYKADAILVGRYTPSSMGPIPPAITIDPLARPEDSSSDTSSVATEISASTEITSASESMVDAANQNIEPAQGPWLGDWLLLQNEVQRKFADETPEVKGLFNSAIDYAADYFAQQYAIMPTTQGAQQIVLRIGNITSFAAFKQVQSYLESLALVQRMEVVAVNAEGVLVRLTTDADARLLTNTLALGHRMTLLQAESTSVQINQISPVRSKELHADLDSEAMADLERALARELSTESVTVATELDPNAQADGIEAGTEGQVNRGAATITAGTITAGTMQDPLIYVWQK